MKRFFIVLSVAVLVFCCAVGGFEIVRDNGFQKLCVADYPQKQTKQCPRCVGTGRCSVCQGRGYFVAMGSGEKRVCRTCAGSGKCQTCGGRGRVVTY